MAVSRAVDSAAASVGSAADFQAGAEQAEVGEAGFGQDNQQNDGQVSSSMSLMSGWFVVCG